MLLAAFLALAQPTPPRSASPIVNAIAPTPHGRLIGLPDEAVAYVPTSTGSNPPLLVLLHGAGRSRMSMIEHFEAQADKRGIVLLAPTSLGPTWDVVRIATEQTSPGSALAERLGYRYSGSRDSKRVEAAIGNLAKTVPVDPMRTVLAGFSDGATFALAMGMARSRTFAAVIAWSPGIPIETSQPARGRRVFVSHGRRDQTLSFAVDCAEIVPLLQAEGAAVSFMPFDGVHELPEVAKDAFLDAAFGGVAGTPSHPLPTEKPVCHGTNPDMPELPQPQPMMTPMG